MAPPPSPIAPCEDGQHSDEYGQHEDGKHEDGQHEHGQHSEDGQHEDEYGGGGRVESKQWARKWRR